MVDVDNESPTFPRVLRQAIDARLIDVNTSIPARIEKYDGKKADVQPLIKRGLTDDTTIDLPVITDVPVVWPQTENAAVILPLAKGDTGYLVFSQRSIDRWKVSDGKTTDPLDPRKFHMSDAVFQPGLKPFTKTSEYDPERLVVLHGTGKLTINKSGKIRILRGSDELLTELDKGFTALGAEPMLASKTVYAAVAVKIKAIKE